MSELKKIQNSEILVVCFAGLWHQMGGIQPFEFLNFLTKSYENIDSIFYIDKHQSWYHKGIQGITKNIDETVKYLDRQIKGYKKVIFMGVSSGGYAAILFGSLCNIQNVVAFMPQTIMKNLINQKYRDLKPYINLTTKYFLFGNLSAPVNDVHHISQCRRICPKDNVILEEIFDFNMKVFRDSGQLKAFLDNLIF